MYKERHSFDGKVIVITGALGILGRHFTEGFVEMGGEVALVDLPATQDEAWIDALQQKFSRRMRFYGCDITSPEEVRALASKLLGEFGKVDILLNNAASKSKDLEAFFSPFEDYSLNQWHQIFSVNVDGTFLMSQSIGKLMLQQESGGTIINLASIYGILAPDQRIYEGSLLQGRPINTPAVYAASKAAVVGLTNYLAAYWGDRKIRVNCITPGGVESGQNEIFQKKYSARVPMARMAKAEEIVGAALYLASENAAYMNGHNLVVDGGLSVW